MQHQLKKISHIKMNIAKFKKEFDKAKISQNEFSNKSGVNVSTINRILSGSLLDIRGDTIIKLEKQLNLKKGALL